MATFLAGEGARLISGSFAIDGHTENRSEGIIHGLQSECRTGDESSRRSNNLSNRKSTLMRMRSSAQEGRSPATSTRSPTNAASLGFAANMPEEVGGGGLNHLDLPCWSVELGRGSMGLTVFLADPPGILMACEGEQRERYLLPAVRGEKFDALAMTEPDAGSDVRGMKCAASDQGGDWMVNGTKHFISHADIAGAISSSSPQVRRRHRKVKKRSAAFSWTGTRRASGIARLRVGQPPGLSQLYSAL